MGEAKNRGSYLERLDAARKRDAEIAERNDTLQAKLVADAKAASERYGMELGALRVQPARLVAVDLDKLVARLDGGGAVVPAMPSPVVTAPEFDPLTDCGTGDGFGCGECDECPTGEEV